MSAYEIEGQKVRVYKTGFAPGDHFPAFCAMVLLPDPWVCDVAYGETEDLAFEVLRDRVTAQAFVGAVKEGGAV